MMTHSGTVFIGIWTQGSGDDGRDKRDSNYARSKQDDKSIQYKVRGKLGEAGTKNVILVEFHIY